MEKPPVIEYEETKDSVYSTTAPNREPSVEPKNDGVKFEDGVMSQVLEVPQQKQVQITSPRTGQKRTLHLIFEETESSDYDPKDFEESPKAIKKPKEEEKVKTEPPKPIPYNEPKLPEKPTVQAPPTIPTIPVIPTVPRAPSPTPPPENFYKSDKKSVKPVLPPQRIIPILFE